MDSTAATTGVPRGRPPAATRDEVLAAATDRYLRGERVDVQSIASRLGLGRTTIYRWFGSRDGLIGAVLVRAAENLLEQSYAAARGKGAEKLLDTFDRYNRGVSEARGLRRFVDEERDAAVRILTRGDGYFQPRLIALVTNVIEREVSAGGYQPPVEPATLAYAIVRLGEAFIYNETATGMRGDFDRLREVQGLVLGVRPNGSEPAPGRARK